MRSRVKLACLVGLCAVALLVAFVLRRRSGSPLASRAERSGTERAPTPAPIPGARPAASILGTVRDPDAKPVREARVCAVRYVSAQAPVSTCVESDAGGRYAVVALAAGRYVVSAAREGFVGASAQQGRALELADAMQMTGVDIVLQPGGARVSGVVVDAIGGPVPHAIVRGEHNESPPALVHVEADDAGRFALWLPPGFVRLFAQGTGYAPAHWRGPAPSVDVRLVLTPGATLRGQVISATDKGPLAAVDVRADAFRGVPSSRWAPSSTSAADGTFELRGVEPGSYKLIATGEGVRGELANPIHVPLGATIENITIEVAAAAQVSGRVLLSRTREPCQQGFVRLGPPTPRQPPLAEDQHSQDAPPSGLSFGANIQRGGLVRFPAVPPGRYYVNMQCATNVLREGPRVLDVGSSPLTDLEWIVGRGPTLTVLTVDERDRPLPNAGFFVMYPQWNGSPLFATPATTDDEGQYMFAEALYPGTYEIKPGLPFDADTIRVPIHERDEGPVTAKLKFRGTASLEATVQTKDAVPVDGLMVTAVLVSGVATPARQASAPPPPRMNIYLANPLGEGKYQVRPLKAGKYELRVDDRVNGTVRKTVSVASGETARVNVEIDRGGRIRGRVVDDDGAPVPDAWVAASAANLRSDQIPPGDESAGDSRVLTDSNGAFVVERLAGGDATYTLHAEQPTGATAMKKEAKVGEDNVVLTMHAAVALAGNVLGDCGGSGGPITVIAQNADTGQSVSQSVSARERLFHVNLAPGHVDLFATCGNGSATAHTTIDVAPKSEPAELSLVLE